MQHLRKAQTFIQVMFTKKITIEGTNVKAKKISGRIYKSKENKLSSCFLSLYFYIENDISNPSFITYPTSSFMGQSQTHINICLLTHKLSISVQ